LSNRLVASAAAIAAAFALLLVVPGTASAHEERTIGKYHFAVGFGDEPAYTGLKNSVQLLLRDSRDRPVTKLTDTLKVEVIYGAQKTTLPLEPFFEIGEFGIPGDYRAWFFPTEPGRYSFRFTGSIKGQSVDASFTSGPTTFSEVEDPTPVQLPVKEPSAAQVAARLDREVPRLSSAVDAASRRASDQAHSARPIAFIGLGVGVLSLVVAGFAVVRSRRPAPAAPVQPSPAAETRG